MRYVRALSAVADIQLPLLAHRFAGRPAGAGAAARRIAGAATAHAAATEGSICKS